LSRPGFDLCFWDCRFQPQQFDYRRFLASDSTAAELIEEFLRTGVCLLGDAPTDPDSSEQLAARLGPIREVVFGDKNRDSPEFRVGGQAHKSEVGREGRNSGLLYILDYLLVPPYNLRFPHSFFLATSRMLESQ